MILLHNFGNHIPPNAAYDGGNLDVYAANAHTAFPGVPRITEIVNESDYATEGSFAIPPSGLVASVLASSWTISASLSAGDASLSVFQQEVSLNDLFLNPIITIGERITTNGAAPGIRFGANEKSGDSQITLTVICGSLSSVAFAPSQNKWVWPVSIFISYTNRTDSGPPLGVASISRGLFGAYTEDFPEAGVIVDYFGENVVLYGADDDDLNYISGNLAIGASKYLSPINAP